MPIAKINGVNLYYEIKGEGEPIVFVHGSWGDHHSWDAAARLLSRDFRVLTYDRRGHSQSERADTRGSVNEDCADLAGLIGHLRLAPAHIAGNSYGASITLRTACTSPDIVRTVIINEPPLLDLLAEDPASQKTLTETQSRIRKVAEVLETGDHEAGAKLFTETIAGGPGYWDQLTPEIKERFIFNAPTWLDETKDPESLTIDTDMLKKLSKPVFLTCGEISPPFFALITDMLAKIIPDVTRHTYARAGHGPHSSHPENYVKRVKEFIRSKS